MDGRRQPNEKEYCVHRLFLKMKKTYSILAQINPNI